jgi:hypothetical protein
MLNSILVNGLIVACCALAGCDQSGGIPSGGNAHVAQEQAVRASSQSRSPAVLPSVSEARLLDDLRSQDFDRVIKTMNEVKRVRYSGYLAQTLISLWDGSNLYGVDRDFVNHPRIRLEIADILAQMEKNGYQKLNNAAFADYARGLVAVGDTHVANQAIRVLGIAGSADDMLLLERMAEDISEHRFRSAILALGLNCNTTSVLIDKLRAKLKEQWRKDFLAEVWDGSSQFRVCSSR